MLLLRPLGLVWTEDHGHIATIEPWIGLDLCEIIDPLSNVIENFPPELGMGYFPASEHDGDLDLVSLTEEPLDLTGLGLEIAARNLRAVLHLFDGYLTGLFPGFFGSLSRLVLVLAVIHDAADGRMCLIGDLDQVEFEFTGEVESFGKGLDTKLIAIGGNHPDFASTDLLIDPWLLGGSYCWSLFMQAQLLIDAVGQVA